MKGRRKGVSAAAGKGGGASYGAREEVFGDAFSPVLQGVCDLHVHAAPDTRARLVDEIDFALEAKNAGYRAVLYKSNAWSSHDRAFLVDCAVSGVECFGGLCMNACVGDRVNVRAAQLAVETAGERCKCIWMPTLDSAYQNGREGRAGAGIAVLDGDGKVLPEVVRVMEICAQADIMFATGHSAPRESLVLAKKAREVGVGKFVVTHANSHFWTMTEAQIRTCVDLGAYIEYCYLPCLWGEGTRMPQYKRQGIDEFARFVRIAPERSFISTDLGQAVMPHPVEGMAHCLRALREAGVGKRDEDLLVRRNPAWLIGLDKQ